MKNYIKTWESNQFFPEIRLSNKINLTRRELDKIKNVKWEDLNWKNAGDDGNKIIWLELTEPFNDNIKSGIKVDIQLIGNSIYQIHINLADSLQNIGLGSKIYRSIIDWAGHLYSGKGRRHNPFVDNIWEKMKNVEGVTCLTSKFGDICISNRNPDKEILKKIFSKLG